MLRLAVLGLEPWQHHWIDAVAALRAAGEIELVAVGHLSAAGARQHAEAFKAGGAVAAYDDPRRLVQEAAPQIILLQRPANVSLDFLSSCAAQEIGIFSLGPAVESLAEAQALAQVLEPRTHLLHIWPHFADSPAARRCAQADEFLRPIRFASACWLGLNHALARAGGDAGAPAESADSTGTREEARVPVRSLSVLAWDLLGTLIPLMGMPSSVYAAIRGTVGSGQNFADISGAASVTLRFADDAAASLTICDRIPAAGGGQAWNRRDLMLWGKGTLRLMGEAYEFRDEAGKLIDASAPADAPASGPPVADAPLFAASDATAAARAQASAPILAALRDFFHQYAMPASPLRGRPHRLVEIAAVLEALVVSHRTGQPESPERLQQLRR